MLHLLKSLASRILSHDLRQNLKRRLFHVRDMQARLSNLKSAGFNVTSAIDGGSYHGSWTQEVWNVWPKAPVLLVEPQPNCQVVLESLALRVQGSQVASCALGSNVGTVEFSLDATNSGVVTARDPQQEVLRVPMTTLDALTEGWQAPRPNFLKLDLQGYELEALRGATRTLLNVEVLLIEISVLRIGEVPVFREVDRFMEELGFCLYDIIPQYYRPLDNALWQVDAFYVRDSSPLISSRAWS